MTIEPATDEEIDRRRKYQAPWVHRLIARIDAEREAKVKWAEHFQGLKAHYDAAQARIRELEAERDGLRGLVALADVIFCDRNGGFPHDQTTARNRRHHNAMVLIRTVTGDDHEAREELAMAALTEPKPAPAPDRRQDEDLP